MSDDFPDLYAFVLRLAARQRGELPASYGHLVQGLFMALLEHVDPALAREQHLARDRRNYTLAGVHPVGPAMGGTLALRPGDPVVLRITLLQGALFGPVARTLMLQSTRPPLRLGSVELDLLEVIGTPGRDRLAGYAHWRDLAARAAPEPVVTLQFATPTAISQGEDRDEDEERATPRMGLLPTPELIFGSLARRWAALAPPEMAPDLKRIEAAARRTVVRHYELKTTTHAIGRKTQVGFLGRCSYELRGGPEERRLLNMLADAAFYTGVGIKTARGMGLCYRRDGEGRR
jgi:CRISPR-associated endoribonuclease Cas6